MKYFQHLYIIFIAFYVCPILHAEAPPIKCVTTPDATFNSCEMFTKRDSDGKMVPSDAYRKNYTPLGSMLSANLTNISFTSKLTHQNHPSGSSCFPTDGTLASLLNQFLTSVEDIKDASWEQKKAAGKDNLFLKYFTRIQLTVQFQVYQYLLGIYSTLNMSHAQNMIDYLTNERSKDLNKKTLILNHLVNIMETQLSESIRLRFPALDKSLASHVGPMLMTHDYGANLDLMIKGQEKYLIGDKDAQKYLKEQRELYTTIFGKYLNFFNSYTASLIKKDTNIFLNQAQFIKNLLSKTKPKINTTISIDALSKIKSINPPLFFYKKETIRAIQLIPAIAEKLNPNSQKVDWPAKVVENAKTGALITDKYGNVVSTYPRAYFVDQDQNITKNKSKAVSLFINIPTLDNIYSQEVIKQPSWLNSYEGIMQILSLCLGNYCAAFYGTLAQENILDPCISYIILAGMQSAGLLKDPSLLQQAHDASTRYFIQYLALLSQDVEQAEDTPSLPTTAPPEI